MFSFLTGLPKEVFYESVALLITAGIGMIIKSLWHLPVTLNRLEQSMKLLEGHVQEDEKIHSQIKGRITVLDRILSKITKQEIDSEKINIGISPWPSGKKYEN
jgi:hypothetical protein